jgi:hypothetical protein
VGNHHYYLVTALPVLGDLGSRPPMTQRELAERVAGSSASPLVRVVLLEEDLLLRDGSMAGELTDPGVAVLTPGQARGKEPLPDALSDDARPAHRAAPADAVWAAWVQHAMAVARDRRSALLMAWVAAEVGLRNALAAARARSLGLDPTAYVVAPDLGEPRPREDAVLSAWAAAPTPLAGYQLLLRARWAWLAEHAPRYSFGDDELTAYALRLSLLHRWHRSSPGEGSTQRGERAPGAVAA